MTSNLHKTFFPVFHAALFIVISVTLVFTDQEKSYPKQAIQRFLILKLVLVYVCISIPMLALWKLRSQNIILTFYPNPRKLYEHSYSGTHQYRKYTGKDLLDYSVMVMPPYVLYCHMDMCIYQRWYMMVRNLSFPI